MKKGFTLIELLAVIVILAIIAVIAVPIVLNIVNGTKESATLRSADFYLDGVELSVSQAILKEIYIQDGEYPIMNNGNVCIGTLTDDTCEGKIIEVEVKGEKPSSGTITITGGQISYVLLNLSNKVVIKTNKGEYLINPTLVDYIKKLYSETTTATVNEISYNLDEIHLLMNDRLGNKEISKVDGNIRYYGKNPNNYIDIGDRDSEGNIIFWRIIGLFKDMEVTDESGNVIGKEDLIKIMRSDFLIVDDVTRFPYDYKTDGTNDNDWKTSSINSILNGAYYNSSTTQFYDTITSKSINFKSMGLSSEVLSKVELVNWNISGKVSSNGYIDEEIPDEILDSDLWSGKIGLIHPSDYAYASNIKECQLKVNEYSSNVESCINTNWIYNPTEYQWTMIYYRWANGYVFSIHPNGNVSKLPSSHSRNVRPVLYLKSNVSIVEEKTTTEGLNYFVVE